MLLLGQEGAEVGAPRDEEEKRRFGVLDGPQDLLLLERNERIVRRNETQVNIDAMFTNYCAREQNEVCCTERQNRGNLMHRPTKTIIRRFFRFVNHFYKNFGGK